MCTSLESESADDEVDEEVEELARLSSSGTKPSVRLESRSAREWEASRLVVREEAVLPVLVVERDGALVMVMLVNSRLTCRGK